jgi:hypothetical protein
MEERECRSGKNVIHGGRVGAGTADFSGAPMLSSRSRFRPAGPVGAILTVLTLVLAVGSGQAQHIVYLKDGTVLHGRIFTQREKISDGGMDFTVFKSGSFFAVGDGVRAVIFSTRNIDPSRGTLGTEETDIRKGFLEFKRDIPRPDRPTPSAGTFEPSKPDEWNERGERTLKLHVPQLGVEPIRQRLTYLTPYMFRLDGVEHRWVSCFLLDEMDPKMIQKLLLQFDKVAEKDGNPDPLKRMLIFRFWVQAKNLDMAEAELVRLLKDMPAEKARVDKAREELRALKADQDLQNATAAFAAGQIKLAQAFLQRIPKEGLDPDLSVSVNTLRVKIDSVVRQWESAYRYLRRLPGEAGGTAAETLCEAAAAIREGLYVEGLDRLEPFLSLAEQADRAKAANREPAQRPEELLALAVTGWLLGKEQAEKKPDVAAKLWRARQFALEYLATHDASKRGRLLAVYRKHDPVEVEELARLVGTLPPPEPAEEEVTVNPLTRRTRGVSGRSPVKYEILPPQEYRPGRPYPLLVVLNHKGERPLDVLKRFGYQALKNGYILVAPDYADVEGTYTYSADEHQRVLDVIRDAEQRYHVDSDRVFLSGWGEGGNAAWDIGLSHPDLFAGVLPMSSQPRLSYTIPYWSNARNLPFYVVTGDLAGDSFKQIQRVVTEWLQRGFPAMHSVYLGRGVEWYGAELPFMFDWMNKKKRMTAFPELGVPGVSLEGSEAYKMMRATDNRFYWVGSDQIESSRFIDNKGSGRNAARIQASIKPGNEIRVYTVGLKDVTLSFGPGMIDFAKPIAIQNSGTRGDKRVSKIPVKPNLATMMEDLYERGDSRRPVLAQYHFTP